MPVTTTIRSVTYSGNGSTSTPYTVTFPYDAAANVKLLIDGVASTAFTLSGDELRTDEAVDAGSSLVIYRDTPLTQEQTFPSNTTPAAENVRAAVDKLTLITQERNEEIGRSIKPSIGSSFANNTTLGVDASGNPVARTAEEEVDHLGIGGHVQDAKDAADEAAQDAALAKYHADQAEEAADLSTGVTYDNEVWIGYRTDDLVGSGTVTQPWDGSTPDKLADLLNALPPNTRIHLMAGDYELVPAYTANPNAVRLKEGQWLEGSGIGITTIKAVSDTPVDDNFRVIEGTLNADNITVSDMTIDSDWGHANLYSDTHAGGSVALRGNNCRIINIHAKNFGGDDANNRECFPLAMSKLNTGSCENCLIEGCLATDIIPGGTNTTTYTSVLWIDGSGWIRNNKVIGRATDGDRDFGAVTGSPYLEWVIVEDNIFQDLDKATNGDTWSCESVIVRRNFCDNIRGICFTQAYIRSYERCEYIEFSDNEILVAPERAVYDGSDSLIRIGIAAVADEKISVVKVERNTVRSKDGVTDIPPCGFRFFNIQHLVVRDNIWDPLCGEVNELQSSPVYPVDFIVSSNNRFEDGTIRVNLPDTPLTPVLYKDVITLTGATLDLIQEDHGGGYIRCTNATSTTLNLQDEATALWVAGEEIEVRRTSAAGSISITLAGGVTLEGDNSASVPQGGNFRLKYLGSDEWDFITVT